jgi:hypothetical protein
MTQKGLLVKPLSLIILEDVENITRDFTSNSMGSSIKDIIYSQLSIMFNGLRKHFW